MPRVTAETPELDEDQRPSRPPWECSFAPHWLSSYPVFDDFVTVLLRAGVVTVTVRQGPGVVSTTHGCPPTRPSRQLTCSLAPKPRITAVTMPTLSSSG